MAKGQPLQVLDYFERLLGDPAVRDLADCQLLERFASQREEAAFAELVRRHERLVWGVCRRILGHEQDAEDAFQAAFLVLARKAAVVRWGDSVASWLHEVAYRLAVETRSKILRRNQREMEMQRRFESGSDAGSVSAELLAVLDEELRRLPERYRAPVLLCYLEAIPRVQAARALGWSLRTLERRLAQGRDLLRARLTGRGMNLSEGLLASALLGEAGASAPARLVSAIVRGSCASTGAAVVAGSVSQCVISLAEGALTQMAVAKLKVIAALALTLSLVVAGGGLLARQVLTEDSPSAPAIAEDRGELPIAKDSKEKAAIAESRIWYILGQDDTVGLLHPMPYRLSKVIAPAQRKGPLWDGVEGGGELQLDIQVEDDVKGEIFVGFFAEATWSAKPVQVRRFPGPGRYTVDRLIPGAFRLGAMIGSLPRPFALGVHRDWPASFEIKAKESTSVQLRLSPKFRDHPMGAPNLEPGLAGNWGKMDPTRMITVLTLAGKAEPSPFGRITFASRVKNQPNRIHEYIDVGTDDKGYAYCDRIDGLFSLAIQRFDFVPETFTARSQFKRMAKLHSSEERLFLLYSWEPFPRGDGKVVGHVRNQHGRPLSEFYVSLQREEGDRMSNGDYAALSYCVPIIDATGRYEVRDLPPGTYQATVRGFDYAAYTRSFDGPSFVVTEGKADPVRLDIEVEAKELLYGRAVYITGEPVFPASWTAWFELYDREKRFQNHGQRGESFSQNLEKDGSFRVTLSQKEREKLLKTSEGRVEITSYRKDKDKTYRDTIGTVAIDKLSKDRANPTKLVFPRPEAAKPAHPGFKDPADSK